MAQRIENRLPARIYGKKSQSEGCARSRWERRRNSDNKVGSHHTTSAQQLREFEPTNLKHLRRALEGHTHNVACVGFLPGLPLIATGSEDGTVRIASDVDVEIARVGGQYEVKLDDVSLWSGTPTFTGAVRLSRSATNAAQASTADVGWWTKEVVSSGGGLRVGPEGAACDETLAGTVRFDAATGKLAACVSAAMRQAEIMVRPLLCTTQQHECHVADVL